MRIKRILKSYLVATLILTTFSLLNYNDTFKSYMADSYVDVMGYKYNDPKSYLDPSRTPPKETKSLNKIDYKDNPSAIFLKITNDGSKSMVHSGAKFAEFMTLSFKVDQEKASLETLNFSIHGIAPKNIKNAYLFEKKKLIATASISDGYIKFSNIEYALNSDAVSALTLRLNLSEELKVGDIIRLDIDQPSDLNVKINGLISSLNGHYPMKEKSLSIVGSKL